MRLFVSDTALIPALVESLRSSDCVAEPVGRNAVDVLVPGLRDRDEARQALVEVQFFASAWAAIEQGVEIRLR